MQIDPTHNGTVFIHGKIQETGFMFINKPPAPTEIREQFPLDQKLAQTKQQRDEDVKRIFTGESDKFIVIIGLCPADNEEPMYGYTGCLIKVQEKTRNKFTIIPCVYTNKPRTTDEGCMGTVYQPDPEKKPDIFENILAIHHMRMKVLHEADLVTAGRMLYPDNLNYPSDMMAYVTVDAYSIENQYHRLVASGCDVPMGMKNLTNGDLAVMLNSVVTAQLPHDFIFRSNKVRCPGNPLTHTILRGTINKRRQCIFNYRYKDLKLLFDLYVRRDLKNPARIMDTNHSSSNRQYKEQICISGEVLHGRHHPSDIKELIKGFMIRSYIEPSSQKIGQHCYGQSTIDPCLGWKDSEWPSYEIIDDLD